MGQQEEPNAFPAVCGTGPHGVPFCLCLQWRRRTVAGKVRAKTPCRPQTVPGKFVNLQSVILTHEMIDRETVDRIYAAADFVRW